MATLDTEELEKKSLNYFSRYSYLNKTVVTQEKSLIKYLGTQWNELPLDRKHALLDLLFVDDDVREQYHNTKSDGSDGNGDVSEIDLQESFPRLHLNSGQKINVDFENDLWTWRDEHSGPFSWMSRSQQDLTLADLEPENISRPQPKLAKVDSEEENNVKKAEPQFTYPSNCWCNDVISEYRKNEGDIVLTPSTSMNLTNIRPGISTEEVNPAFQDSRDDLSSASTPSHDIELKEIPNEDTESLPSSGKKSKGKDKKRRSPSPKKIIRSGSFKKSPAKSSDHGEQKLIGRDDVDTEDGTHAFSNPVMESEWSTFVGDEDQKHSEMQIHPVTNAPEPMTMDRGNDMPSNSPYRGDKIRLVEREESPLKLSSSAAKVLTPAHSDWSTESTPDQTTHLLKGMQSPEHHSHKETITNPATVETEEVLRVEMTGNDIKVTTEEIGSKRDSDIPTTGFDFLDNW